MQRGDIVTVAASGDYGKPRPAVIVQTDVLPPDHPSVVVCQMTSTLTTASWFRVRVEPSPESGLREPSEVMVDKPTTVLRTRLGRQIGRLSAAELARVDVAITVVMGLADP